jgi:hypothetical protein
MQQSRYGLGINGKSFVLLAVLDCLCKTIGNMSQQMNFTDHVTPKSPTELKMWEKPPRPHPAKLTEDEIDLKYTTKEERIVTESNREKLPNFVEALKRPNYMNVRPFYQRRRRWCRLPGKHPLPDMQKWLFPRQNLQGTEYSLIFYSYQMNNWTRKISKQSGKPTINRFS